MTDQEFVPAVPLPGVDPEQYPFEFYPYLYEGYEPYTPEPDPTPEPTPEPTPTPADEPTQEPVISVGDLLDLLQEEGAAPAPSEEIPAEVQTAADPGDTVAVELTPGELAIVDAIKGLKSELILISDQMAEIQIAEERPLFTTPFEDYTVSEGLLLFLLLALFLSACYKLLRGGFQWLRS